MGRRRRASYYRVDGFDLARELDRLRGLPVFARGELPGRRPTLGVRRARRRPNRVGFAIPSEWRISVTAYPGVRRADLQETLLHELVHLHVGERPGAARRWHGRAFRRTLHRAMREAYGVDVPMPRSVVHGVYAEAIERSLTPEQLELPLAA
jgi:SprT-like family protein